MSIYTYIYIYVSQAIWDPASGSTGQFATGRPARARRYLPGGETCGAVGGWTPGAESLPAPSGAARGALGLWHPVGAAYGARGSQGIPLDNYFHILLSCKYLSFFQVDNKFIFEGHYYGDNGGSSCRPQQVSR